MPVSTGILIIVNRLIAKTLSTKIAGAHGHPGMRNWGPSRSRKRIRPATAAAVQSPSENPM